MSATERIEAAELASLPLFEGLTEAELAPLAAASIRRRLADGETLVEMGDPISEIHWLERGQLADHFVRNLKSLSEDPTALSTARAIGPAVMMSVPAAGLLGLLAGGSPHSGLLLRRLFGIATQHLDESRAQLLQLGREGVISAG